MKINIKIGLLILAFSSLASEQLSAQQAYSYTQYMNNLTPLNSAYNAVSGSHNLSALVRQQWTGIEGAPSTVFITGGFNLPTIKSSAGLIIANTRAGIEKQFEATAFFAKSVSLAENTQLTVSGNAGISQFNANYNELDSFDPKFRDNVSTTAGLLGLGLMLHSDKFYVGVSVPRISLQDGNSKQRINPEYYAMGGYIFDTGTSLKIKPAVLLSYVSNLPFKTDVSVTAYLKEQIGLGVNYGSNKEFAGIISYAFKNNLAFGYSYQFAAGAQNLGSGANSTQELSLRYHFGSKKGSLIL